MIRLNPQTNAESFKTIYKNEIKFKNDKYTCIINYEESKIVQFLMSSNSNKSTYEKIFHLDKGNQKGTLELIIENLGLLKIKIDNITQNKLALCIIIDFENEILHIIYLEKIEADNKKNMKKILDYDVNELLRKCANNKDTDFFRLFPFRTKKNCYIFDIDEIERYIIFKSPIKMSIVKNKKLYFSTNINTNYELKKILKDKNIDMKNIYVNDEKLIEVINDIYSFVDSNKLNLIIEYNRDIEIKFMEKELNPEQDYYPSEYSKYFKDYFPKGINYDKKLIYYQSDEREEIHKNVDKLYDRPNIKKYLITGPYSCGKSMTMFRLSRINRNIIYINLKILKKNEDDKEKCIKMIISEFHRLNIDINEFNNKFEHFNFNKNILAQLLDILEIILDLSKNTIILILDQYKSSYVESCGGFMAKIEDFINKKYFKLIQCSSINDNEIRDLFLPTWKTYSSNPPQLNYITQKYYFYYYKLYNPSYNTYSEKLFCKKYKYMDMLENKNTYQKNLDAISDKIIGKLRKFRQYEDSKNNFNFYDITLDDILIFLYKNIKKDLEKAQLIHYVSICPLKFFIIDIKEDKFQILPLFPFLEYFLFHSIEKCDCDNYFQKGRYKHLTFLSNSVKGEYFEFSVKKAINNNQILNIEDKDTFESIKLYEICKMDKIINDPYQEIIKKLNEEKSSSNSHKNRINIIKNKNNYIDIDLKPKKDNSIIIENELQTGFANYYSINKMNDELIKYKNVINEIELGCLKTLNDYKKDEIEIRIKKKKNDCINEYKKLEKNKTIKVKICDIDSNSKSDLEGDENIILDQQNPYGKMVDYAVLIGPAGNKIFIGFQIKCYSKDTKLDAKFVNKQNIKEVLQPILLNCKDVFNCVIKKWYYYLIFYYNQDDDIINQVGYFSQFQCIFGNIAYLLYDPKEKKFLTSSHKHIKKLKLTKEADLDHSVYLNMKLNYQTLQLKYNSNVDNVNIDSYRNEYFKEFHQFIKDLNQYGNSPEKILQELSKVLSLKELYYNRASKTTDLIYPSINKIVLFSKKDNKGYISIIKTKKTFEVYDLLNKKTINDYSNESLNKRINFERYAYILSTTEPIRKNNSLYYMRKIIEEKYFKS